MAKSALALFLVFLLGCGTTATITRNDGSKIEGTILDSSDDDSLSLDPGNGSVTEVRRSDIVDIDHPGNGALTAGIILSAYGVLNIIVGAPKCEEEGAAFCTGVFTPLVLGLGLSIYGGTVYSRSLSAASGKGQERALQLRILPTFQVANGPTSAGLLVGAVF